MKRILMALSLVVIFAGCTKKSITWEYRELKITNTNSSSSYGKMSSSDFDSSESSLNSLGNEGWELTTSYTLIETEYPNFGNEGYHTGIKTNTRTEAIVYVFKREKKDKK